MRVAAIACWLWFGLAFVVGKGGPFLNTVLYPAVILVVGPWITSLAVFGTIPGSFLSGTAYVSAYSASGLSIFLPGLLLGNAVAGGYLIVLYLLGRSSAWADEHVPEEYHEIEIDEDRY